MLKHKGNLMTIALTLLALVLTFVPIEIFANPQHTFDEFLHAVGQVESGHDDEAVGDDGDSIGRYQIQRAYWIDATEYDKSIGGVYEDVKDPVYAEKIMRAYFKRYAKKAYENNDFEKLARIHNGGPNGHKIKATQKYWGKVKAVMQNE